MVVVEAAVVGLATGQPAPASFVYLEGRILEIDAPGTLGLGTAPWHV
ncbi:MAG: hypothetical protein OXC09_09630 [Truepera sp.]|nr:hypothetical protein [Truepera sp.]